MIRLNKITVTIDNITIIQNISFTINQYEKIAIYGRSGSGKTTILKVIIGAHIPSAGQLIYQNQPINRFNIALLRDQLSYIGQVPMLGASTVKEAVLLPYSFKKNREKQPAQQNVHTILEELWLEKKILDKNCEVLSGGEKQRIAIARELLLGKKLFILDEITSGLDQTSKKAVLQLFNREKITYISVSHDPDWLENCSQFIHLDQGQIIKISDQYKTDNVKK